MSRAGALVEPLPTLTVASVQATLRQAAALIGVLGLAQGTEQMLTGQVCVLRAVHLAADGDARAELGAYSTLALLLEAETGSWWVTTWNDDPARSAREAQDLLLRATQVVVV